MAPHAGDKLKVNKKVDIMTVIDPVTGKEVKQIIQTFTDPLTGQTRQEHLPANITSDNINDG